MPGPTVDEIQAALDTYKASIANATEKRVEKDAKLAVALTAASEAETASTAHAAAVQAMINAELELQRLNDEHTPET